MELGPKRRLKRIKEFMLPAVVFQLSTVASQHLYNITTGNKHQNSKRYL